MIRLLIFITISVISFSGFAQAEKKGTIKVKKQGVHTTADIMPSYPGGIQYLSMFIQQNVKYPQEEKEKEIYGTVVISFIVETDGTLSDFKVVKGVKDGIALDQEALRAAKLMPKWLPAQDKGKPVRLQMNLPIAFRLK